MLPFAMRGSSHPLQHCKVFAYQANQILGPRVPMTANGLFDGMLPANANGLGYHGAPENGNAPCVGGARVGWTLYRGDLPPDPPSCFGA